MFLEFARALHEFNASSALSIPFFPFLYQFLFLLSFINIFSFSALTISLLSHHSSFSLLRFSFLSPFFPFLYYLPLPLPLNHLFFFSLNLYINNFILSENRLKIDLPFKIDLKIFVFYSYC